MSQDLTRWNRAGLTRFRYVDGNAATYLERLRAHLANDFSQWPAVQAAPPSEASERERQAHLEHAYRSDPPDMLWQLSRSFARACHVLGEHLDTYANEATLSTATEWDNVRKLVAMLDYHPRPPASAYTSLAIDAKQAEKLPSGFAVRHTPEQGPPIVFETLEDLSLDPALNALHLPGYGRNPDPVSGHTLVLEGLWDQLKNETPLVLEDEGQPGHYWAGVIESVQLDDALEQTRFTLRQPPHGGFTIGHTRVHLKPKEMVRVEGPTQNGAELSKSLRLTEAPADLLAGEVVVLTHPGRKPDFLRIKKVSDRQLTFDRAMGDTQLKGSRLTRPVPIPLARLQRSHWRKEEDIYYVVVQAAGDLQWLQQAWVTHKPPSTDDPLPQLQVIKANYWPVGADEPSNDNHETLTEGYTTLTLAWPVKEGATPNQALGSNPQYLLAIPSSEGPWEPDLMLARSNASLPNPLTTRASKHAAPGDFAVLVTGGQCAWNRLSGLTHSATADTSKLSLESAWQVNGAGAFYRAASRCYVHFTEHARLASWQINDTDVQGKRITLNDPNGELHRLIGHGHRFLLDNGLYTVEARVLDRQLEEQQLKLQLDREVPEQSTKGNLSLRGNVVTAGHGTRKPSLALGSGDATARHQSFELKAQAISFVPDASQASGVRAAVEVSVDGRFWTQIANLNDAGPEEAVYAVRLTEDGTLSFHFGDGQFGRRLPTGNNNLRVSYRQGVGPEANLPPGSLTQPLKPHPAVAGVRQPLPASGGAERESVDALRESAPATLLTLARAVSLTDFAQLARGHASLWQARAFRPVASRQRRDRVDVVVVPAEGADLTPALQDNLLQFLRQHSVPNVDIRVSDYQRVVLKLEVDLRVDLDAYDPDPVREAVRVALLEHFSLRQRKLGQPLYRGEIYQVVEAITGVANSTCHLLLEDEAAARAGGARWLKGDNDILRVIRPGDRQCVHLDPNEPYIHLQVEAFTL